MIEPLKTIIKTWVKFSSDSVFLGKRKLCGAGRVEFWIARTLEKPKDFPELVFIVIHLMIKFTYKNVLLKPKIFTRQRKSKEKHHKIKILKLSLGSGSNL